LKKGTLLFLCFSLVATLAAGGAEDFTLRSPLGTEVEFLTPSFEPGQIILVRIKSAAGVRKVSVHFLGRTYELEPAGGGEEPFAFIGLDLGLPPGAHVFGVTFFRKDGRTEQLEKELSFSAREFPVKKLWVKEKYVTPPPEVQARIEWEAELLQSICSIVTSQWLGDGKFILPHDGDVAPNFGEKRIYNNVPRSTHSGVDISAPYGSPVRAANSGKAVLARELYFSGKTVILNHGLGLYTYYCHFSKIKVKLGDTVKKGEVVGLAGSTGRSTGPHLHWGVRIQDSRVDPLALLILPL
jgi:murein DD-endopeptidase MepM/ murein hydrolase activator NlpD